MRITNFTLDKTRLLPILTKKFVPPMSDTQHKEPKSLSNRQLFRQIIPPHDTLREIEALNLGKSRMRKSNQFGKKLSIVGKKKLERKLGNLTIEKDEHLE
ncbi:912_t:CDS:1, partial [Scutellospora calospora]